MKYLFTFFLCIQILSSYGQQYTIKKLGLEKKLSNNYIIDIAEDKNGYLWFATEDGLNKLEGGLFSSYYKKDNSRSLNLTGNELNCLLDDPQDPVLWIGTQRAGLNAFNYQTNQQTVFLHDENNPYSIATNDVTDLAVAADGNLWVATYWRGIEYLDKKTGKFTHYNQQTVPGLPSNTVWTLVDDHKGNLYIGHAQHGMSILSIKTKKIKNFTYNKLDDTTIPSNNVQCIFKDNTGNLWIGTEKGLALYNPETEHFIRIGEQESPLTHRIYDIQQFNENELWVATEFGGIMFYDTHKQTFHQIFPEEYATQDVRSLYEDKEGIIWVGTSNGVFQIERNSKKIRQHTHIPDNLVRTVIKDKKGQIWVGSFGSGIFLYSSNWKPLKSFNTYLSFPSNTINQIFEDSKGYIWAATGEGLVQFENKAPWKYKVYQRNEGLANAFIWAIEEDENQNIWFSTNQGISCFVRNEGNIYNYDFRDNIPMASFTGRSVCKDKNGVMYFGSTNGLCYFTPSYILEKRQAPKAIIGKITVFEPLVSENSNETEISLINKESVRLKHLQNNFNISFNIQDYSLNERVEYAYMLKGLENAWYTVKEPNNVTFRNLPPGKYEFLIKTRIRNQEWSDEISSIEIIIAPPLWLSWWAKLLYVISGVGLLFTGLWAYKRKLNLEYLYESEKKSHEQEQELNDERLRFYTNITHELRTPLTLILGPLEDLVKSNTLSSKDHHRISVIHQSAVRLLNLINQILDFRKTETQNKRLCVTKGNLTSAVYEIGLKYKELNNKPEIQILIEVEEENMVLFFDKEVITMILDNLISNALKYTEKGYIRIRAEWVTENGIRYAQLSVEDTGYGIGQDALAHIFERYYQESGEHQASGTGIGLALVKNLVKLHEGDIQVKSLPEIGTTFYLRLPAGNTYPQALHGEDIHTDKQDGKEEEPIEKQEVADKDKNARPIILVVEDNADIRDYIADSFTDLYEIKTAANGKEGLQIATDCIPDIIVSDIMMPVMNGVVMCQKLKADIRTSHIPVILLTAKDSITDKEEGYQAGADSYLTKPFSAGLLQSRISNLLTQRRLLSERFAIRPDKPKKQSMEEKRAIITESMNKLDKEFLDKITNTITEGLAAAENIDITVLSNVMCMSSSTLYRKVKALTGMSTNEYIRKIKMQLAEKYLLEGKYSISEIAFKVGINSNVYFRQCFKEEFGMSASDYLKQLTGKSIDEKVDE